MKKEKRVLFVDCGIGTGPEDRLSLQSTGDTGSFIKETLLKDTDSCDIITTHSHTDHTNMINDFFDMINNINESGKADNKIKFKRYSHDELKTNPEISFFGSTDQNLKHQIWIPDYSDEEKVYYNREHDNNLILKISYKEKGILFTGDADGRLYTSYRKSQDSEKKDYKKMFEDADCLIMPHHGSNREGEHVWFWETRDISKEKHKYPLLTIVSSDPKGKDKLPWPSTVELDCDRGEKDNTKTKKHKVSYNDGKSKEIEQPVFITCDSGKFYKISIDDGISLKKYPITSSKGELLFEFSKNHD